MLVFDMQARTQFVIAPRRRSQKPPARIMEPRVDTAYYLASRTPSPVSIGETSPGQEISTQIRAGNSGGPVVNDVLEVAGTQSRSSVTVRP